MTFRSLLVLSGTESCDLVRDMLLNGLRRAYPAARIAADFVPLLAAKTWERGTLAATYSAGWDYHAACGFKSDDVPEPDLVLASESALDGLWGERGEAWLRALLEPYRGRIVSFNGADHAHQNENPVLRELAALRFVSQLPQRWLTDRPESETCRYRALPPSIDASRLPPWTAKRTTRVMFGGSYMQGHGGRWELLEPAVRAGLLDLLVQGQSGWSYLEMLGGARAAIAIGCAGNDPEAGLNTKHIETVCMGTRCLSFPPGVIVPNEPGMDEWLSFRTPDELIELCRRVRADDFDPISPARTAELRQLHSVEQMARRFVGECAKAGIV